MDVTSFASLLNMLCMLENCNNFKLKPMTLRTILHLGDTVTGKAWDEPLDLSKLDFEIMVGQYCVTSGCSNAVQLSCLLGLRKLVAYQIAGAGWLP